MLIKNIAVVLLVIISCRLSQAQFNNNLEVREKFAYEIIQIEEFIQRFNFDNNTKLLKYIKENNPDIAIDRKLFMNTLFENHYFENEKILINDFIDFTSDTANPVYLSFYDNNWFAEVICILEYQNQIDTANLILKNQSNADSSSKWIITGASSKLLEFPDSKDSMKIMSPVSHGTDFIALYNVFKDAKNVQNYITKDFTIDEFTYLVTLMYLNKINIKEVSSTKYHFLQIPNWAFTIEYINRNELNSGWLITGLSRLNQKEKKSYKKKILNIYNSESKTK
ncbi:MAG: hypothetical protein K8S16_21490 [Bacteroidales bacterium]|nr:hypothetical protein [Bacteroidales bacterium]